MSNRSPGMEAGAGAGATPTQAAPASAAWDRDAQHLELPNGQLILGTGVLQGAQAHIASAVSANRLAVIADETVAKLHLSTLLTALTTQPVVLTVPSGEAEKSRERWAELTDGLFDNGLGRDSAIIGLGGGVIGDLAGFVAATYMRGIPMVQMPTTLLAMVDASVGGKTAVDVPAGKNLVGAFHPPALVVADSSVLSTLPVRHARAGVAEMLKHGVLASREHFDAVRAAAGALSNLPDDAPVGDSIAATTRHIANSIFIKARVVRLDPLEQGQRRTLNFGHTVAHALEATTRFAMLHGEAVAVGMVMEARMGEVIGVTTPGTAAELEDALRAVGLPVRLPPTVSFDAMRQWMSLDKKNERGEPACALPLRIGEMDPASGRWSVGIPESVLKEVLGG